MSTILGRHGVNIDSAQARAHADDPTIGVVEILSQRAQERHVRAALQAVEQEHLLRDSVRAIRIEEWRPAGGYF
ncbi:MAG: hypothetical protein AAFY60_06210 [Myxococcota bacterium]